MADVKISELPSGSTLVGTEIIPAVQSGDAVKVTVNQIKEKVLGEDVFFANIPTIPITDPTLDAQVASKKYVDAKDAQLSSDLSVTTDKLTELESEVNVLKRGHFTDSNYSVNIRLESTGNEVPDDNYYTTDFVDISKYSLLRVELKSSDDNTKVFLFNDNKEYVDRYSLIGYEQGRNINIPSGVKYVRVTYKKEVSNTDRILVYVAGNPVEYWKAETVSTSLEAIVDSIEHNKGNISALRENTNNEIQILKNEDTNFDNRTKKLESGIFEQLVSNYKENTGLDSNGNELQMEGYAVTDFIDVSTAWNETWKVYVKTGDSSTKMYVYDNRKVYQSRYSLEGYPNGRVNPREYSSSYVRLVMKMPVDKENYVALYNQLKDSYDIVVYSPSKTISYENIHSIRKAFSLEKKFSALNVKGIVESGKVLLTQSVHVFPNVVLSAHIEGEISNVKIGCGYNGSAFEHYAFYAELTPTEVKIYYAERDNPLMETLEHGLTLTDKTDVSIITENSNSYVRHSKIIITTSNGDVYSSSLLTWFGSGNAFVRNEGSSAINVNLSIYPRSINSKLWLFGDSYFSFWNEDRWGYYLFQNGMTNMLFNHLSGQNPSEGFEDLKHLLSTGHAPSYIVWCHGMNGAGDTIDSDGNPIINATKKEIIDWLVDFCSKNEITLILSTIPTAKVGSSVLLHEGLNNYVRSLGVRYIDFADAVGAKADGSWTEGLCADGVHPTTKGAKVLFGRALCDCPELATNTLM